MKAATLLFVFLVLSGSGLHAQKTSPKTKNISSTKSAIKVADTTYFATVYISDPPFELIRMDMVNGKSFNEMIAQAFSRDPDGIHYTFVDIKTLVAGNFSTQTDMRNVTRIRVSAGYQKASEAFEELKTANFAMGTISFTGGRFSEPLSFEAKDRAKLNAALARCRYGTVITLVDCRTKGSDGIMSLQINKTISLL